jgi:RNA polymerase-binding transcription factor DksA
MNANRARELLTRRRDDLLRVARAATEQFDLDTERTSGGEHTAADQHSADAATDTLERELGLSVRETAEESLRDIEAAFKRLENGTYGICPVCNEPIDDARLEAKPEAEFCVKHQPTAEMAAD